MIDSMVTWRTTTHEIAIFATTADHDLTAGQAYLRASTYYRAALHRHPDPSYAKEVATIAQQAVDAFEHFLILSNYPCEPVRIPYQDGVTLPGYLCITTPNKKAPTIIFNEGKDGWAEDGKFIVDAAIVRGYQVLLYDGPGMGKTIRLQGLPFRHDWEHVLTPVIDYLETIPEVDCDNLALISMSLGGFLGPRATVFEHRLKAQIANAGVINWYSIYEDTLNQIDPSLLPLLESDPDAFDEAAQQLMAASDFMKWGLKDSMWHHGVDKPSALMKELQLYNIEGLVQNITTATLVVDADAEERGQALQLYEALSNTTQKAYMKFTTEEAAQFHVQPGATAIMTMRMMNWLDEMFEYSDEANVESAAGTTSDASTLKVMVAWSPPSILALSISCIVLWL